MARAAWPVHMDYKHNLNDFTKTNTDNTNPCVRGQRDKTTTIQTL